jgi:hypothetical protein
MQKPEESLDDFKIWTETAAEPPAGGAVRFTGEVEVLKPIAGRERQGDQRPATADTTPRVESPYQLSWFQSALAAGGALAVILLVLLSAIFIGMYDSPSGPEAAALGKTDNSIDPAIRSLPEDAPTQMQEPGNSESSTARNLPIVDSEVRSIRLTARPAPARPRHRPKQVVTKFVPTTLVIYAENGEVKKRIEPQLAAVYKKPVSTSN